MKWTKFIGDFKFSTKSMCDATKFTTQNQTMPSFCGKENLMPSKKKINYVLQCTSQEDGETGKKLISSFKIMNDFFMSNVYLSLSVR